MPISKFRITNAGPFDDITFKFDEQVNVFVGPNNSGKSTALMALAAATVFSFRFPLKLLRGANHECIWEIAISDCHSESVIDGYLATMLSPPPYYQGTLDHLNVIGYSTFIPPLRRSTEFRPKGPEIHSTEFPPGLSSVDAEPLGLADWEKRSKLTVTDATLVDDESVIRKMVELDYAAYRRRRPQIRGLIEMVASVASEITEGYPIEFLGIAEDGRGLFPEFKTPDGNLPLNVLSQGTQSIIQWLSHFLFGYAQYYEYPQDFAEKPAILIVDEIDAHLHPSWQRRIIPALTNNFPNLQIFCSTHSPLMLSGLKEGQVQLLKRNEDGKVEVSTNWQDMVGWSAEEILRSVLGVPDTMDLTTASEIDRMGELSIKETLTEAEKAELEKLQQKVVEALGSGPASSKAELALRHIKQIYSEALSESPGKPRPRVRRKESGSA